MSKSISEYKKRCKRVINQYEFFAMRRTGHHAIMKWIFSQIEEPILFANDFYAEIFRGKEYRHGQWISEQPKEYGVIDNYSYNIEDAPIINLDKILEKLDSRLMIVKPEKTIKIFIIRDPFNMMASRFKIDQDKVTKITSPGVNINWTGNGVVERWCEYAQEYLGMTNVIKDKIFINYNQWFVDEQYRRNILSDLNLQVKLTTLLDVPRNGYGSSFDEMKFNGFGNKMKTLDRWHEFMNNDSYINHISNQRLLSLAEKIYPELTYNVKEKLECRKK